MPVNIPTQTPLSVDGVGLLAVAAVIEAVADATLDTVPGTQGTDPAHVGRMAPVVPMAVAPAPALTAGVIAAAAAEAGVTVVDLLVAGRLVALVPLAALAPQGGTAAGTRPAGIAADTVDEAAAAAVVADTALTDTAAVAVVADTAPVVIPAVADLVLDTVRPEDALVIGTRL
jgi:hypothetical protein